MEWENTKEALTNFMSCFKCKKCDQVAENPVIFITCSHFFCKKCVPKKESECWSCGMPVRANEIQPHFFLENLIKTTLKLYDAVYERPTPEPQSELQLEPQLEPPKGKVGRPKSTSKAKSQKTASKKDLIPFDVISVSSAGASDATSARNDDGVLTKTQLKNINKTNRKGETYLHTACVQNKINKVRALLDAGANPNTKDNVPMTPLFEAVSYGYYDIAEMLLNNGALPNTPCIKNKTALHEAVIHNQCREAELLLRFGANKSCHNQDGKTPMDYCNSDEMKEILSSVEESESSYEADTSLDTSIMSNAANGHNTVLPLNLTKQNLRTLRQAADKHNLNIATSFKKSVAIIIVDNDNGTVNLTYDTCLAILHGKWFLSFDWVRYLMNEDNANSIELETFELQYVGNCYGTPSKARKNAGLQKPRLFNNCHFYFNLNSKATYIVGSLELTKESITKLALEGEGKVLTREPKLEHAASNICVPFHVSENEEHPLYKCGFYIIYEPEKEPRMKYNSKHMISLPLVWFVDCIENFSLMNPLNYGTFDQ